MQRRDFLPLPLALAAQASAPLIDTHIHLFASDANRFPFHPLATYQPAPSTLESYNDFAKKAQLTGSIIVHPEPYQDDHSYLEYCLQNEPSKNFFKGTCLFDSFRADTPQRISALTKRWPGRIRALRIHRVTKDAQTAGAIRERPLDSKPMQATWRAVSDLGLMIQMHFIPMHAKAIYALSAEFTSTKVILDHLGRNNQGTPQEWRDILALAKRPNTIMKFSGLEYSPKLLAERVRQVFDSFGPERIIWGGLGIDLPSFAKAKQQLNELFAFTTETNREKIRGRNALKLYGWA
jgi:L-fuconolactonase